MKIPIIKQFVLHAEQNSINNLQITHDTLEHLIALDRLRDEELELIGELLSNLSGAIQVMQSMEQGKSKTEAINAFMQRVVGFVDK
ncbi:MAG: hypothetical protein R2831_03425 [Chitinophagaceae bacterium]